MSRRDTIILAVLINASLLSILFFTATRPDTELPPTLSRQNFESSTPVAIPQANTNSPFIATRPEPQDRLESYGQTHPIAIAERPTFYDAPPERMEIEDRERVVSAPQQEEPIEQYAEVTVKRGDFLEKIARANGISVTEIKRINHLSSDRIDIGQVLLVPAHKRTMSQPTPVVLAQPKNEVSADGVEYYIIKSGDNPWNIARQHRVKFDDLLRLNDLDEDKARNLKPGDKIRVR